MLNMVSNLLEEEKNREETSTEQTKSLMEETMSVEVSTQRRLESTNIDNTKRLITVKICQRKKLI